MTQWAPDSPEALKVRKVGHDRSTSSDPTDPIPACPQCLKPMVLRTAKTGKNEGKQFWGCTGYPECKGVVNV